MADDVKRDLGFVSLKSVTAGAPDPAAALADIRTIYFKTSRRTIDNDFAHALELLKTLPDEETRMKAHVYMEGLAEMARQWGKNASSGTSGRSGASRRSAKSRRSGKVEK